MFKLYFPGYLLLKTLNPWNQPLAACDNISFQQAVVSGQLSFVRGSQSNPPFSVNTGFTKKSIEVFDSVGPQFL